MLDILYRDDHLIAIDKPAGLLVHRSDIDRHETRFAVQLLRDQIGRRVQPVHRLDRGTSGVLLFAFAAEVTRELSARFEAGEVHKTYLAVVRGWPAPAGRIEHALSPMPEPAEGAHVRGGAQAAVTDFRRLATIELPFAVDRYPAARYALMALTPQSGRRHQLRRHMKHIAHPIIGDATHGKGMHNRFFQQQFDCGRMLLAAVALTLRHPVSGAPLAIRSAPGGAFADLLERFGWAAAARAA
jgi:tRNA pseudouridine65 synthase